MNIILRVIDSFNITNRGKIYQTVNETYPSSFKLNEVFYDLLGFRFKVTGIPMHRSIAPEQVKWDEHELMFENIDGEEIHGTILVNKVTLPNILFCNSPLSQKKVDNDYQNEYESCYPIFQRALFSFEDMECRKLSLYTDSIEGITINRG